MSRTQQCDGRKDCVDGEDETTDCGISVFHCSMLLSQIEFMFRINKHITAS